MLKGIDHRLNAEVLGCLRAMGHGDVLIVADTNFPADSVARATVTGRLLRMENLTAAQAVERDPVGAAARHVRGRLRGADGGDRQARRAPAGPGARSRRRSTARRAARVR